MKGGASRRGSESEYDDVGYGVDGCGGGGCIEKRRDDSLRSHRVRETVRGGGKKLF